MKYCQVILVLCLIVVSGNSVFAGLISEYDFYLGYTGGVRAGYGFIDPYGGAMVYYGGLFEFADNDRGGVGIMASFERDSTTKFFLLNFNC